MSVTFFSTSTSEEPESAQALSVNLSNANARLVLDALGYESNDLMGDLDPHDVVRRATMVAPRRLLEGREASDTQRPGFARMIDPGVTRQGILDRVGRLTSLAADAIIRGTDITYG